METNVVIPKDKIIPILAIDRSALETTMGLKDGYNALDVQKLITNPKIQGSYALRRRFELEKNAGYMQLLPYITIVRKNKETGAYEVFLYQRTKLVGEEKLGGKFSIGLGGHIDLADVVCNEEDGLDAWSTVRTNIYRELNEELAFYDGQGIRTDYELGCQYVQHGVITEYSDDVVGKYHVALHLSVIVPEDWTVNIREEELIEVGFVTVEQASTYKLENWSVMVADWMAENYLPTCEAV